MESTAPIIDLSSFIEAVEKAESITVKGRVTEVTGLVIKAKIPGVRIGEVCFVQGGSTGSQVVCEVVGFRDETVMLMPLGEAQGIGPDSEVIASGKPLTLSEWNAFLVCLPKITRKSFTVKKVISACMMPRAGLLFHTINRNRRQGASFIR